MEAFYDESERKKVLILGGGLGAISAARALTKTAERRAKFEVTVVTQGWRLGGKCASGRNRDDHQRIQEHGLHIFLGFYRTAFAVMKQAFDELDGVNDGVFPSVQAAFLPHRHVTLWIDPGETAHRWQHYTLPLPAWPGKPWDPAESLEEMLGQALGRLWNLLNNYAEPELERITGKPFHQGKLTLKLARIGELIPKYIDRDFKPPEIDHHLRALNEETAAGRADLTGEAALIGHLIYDMVEVGMAIARGYLQLTILHGHDNFDAINDKDFRAWLIEHGCSEKASWSEVVRVVYDLAFAYTDGRTNKADASIAAGATLKLMFLMVTGYSDAPLWRMNAGMGDTIFTPLYKLIIRDGATVDFFRRITDVAYDGATNQIESVTMTRQALPDPETAPYDPLVHVHELDCWPSTPKWNELQNGATLAADGVNFEDPWDHTHVDSVTLTRGSDFDHVIMAMPPAASGPVTQSLAAENADWQKMLDKVGGASVATHSVQLWFDRSTEDMGWEKDLSVSGAYVPPLGTWADMSHLLAQEVWNGDQEAKSCQYLVGVVELPLNTPPFGSSAPSFQSQQNAIFKAQSTTWLNNAAFRLWPNSAAPGDFDEAQIVSDYDHVNVAYSELYVQTPPGTVVDRLPPGWNGVPNLWLAGDWTISSINGGSAEAAMESGVTAANALAASLGVA